MAIYIIQTVGLLFAAFVMGCAAGYWAKGRIGHGMMPVAAGDGRAGPKKKPVSRGGKTRDKGANRR